MISNNNISVQVPCDGVFVVIFFKTMYNKTIIGFGFCDILNNQGLGKCYQPWAFASTLIISDITKTSSNNRLIFTIIDRRLHVSTALESMFILNYNSE